MANADSKRRRIESLESMIMHPSTNPNERQAAMGRWEVMTGEKWTGTPKYASNQNTSRSSNAHADPRTNRNGNWNKRKEYDFSHNECTQKQYEFVKSISEFFRWKCPEKHQIEFEEAQDFLNRYADLFKAFSPYSRNFKTLKALFEAFGIDWNQTKRTFKWKAFHER